MNYEVTKLKDRFEAEAVLHWYADCGYYRVSCVGHAPTIDGAKKNASLMLGQARAALTVALIETVPNRVPETKESAEQA
jgi:hypothetical protein